MNNGKYNPKTVEKIVDRIRAGVPKKYAAIGAGIIEDTFYRWLKEKPEFSDAVRQAEADAILRNTALVEKHAVRDWRAASWWLERRAPDDFGRSDKLEVTVKGPEVYLPPQRKEGEE